MTLRRNVIVCFIMSAWHHPIDKKAVANLEHNADCSSDNRLVGNVDERSVHSADALFKHR